jgi:hypothetical protein
MKINYSALNAVMDSTVPPGAFIIEMETIEDLPDKDCLKIGYRIAEGKYMDCSCGIPTPGYDPNVFYACYKESALPFFVKFLTAVNQSNPGFSFNGEDLTAFIGQKIGVVLREEPYISKRGRAGTKLSVVHYCTVNDVRSGNYPNFDLNQSDQSKTPKGAV